MRKKVVVEALNPLHGSVNYLKELRDLSRKNRINSTTAEQKIWQEVLKQRMTGYKFVRQKPVDRFILDFYCSQLNLAIEIDGSSHHQKKNYDEARDKFLTAVGIKTIRFTNEEVVGDIEVVKKKLIDFISPPCQGRG